MAAILFPSLVFLTSGEADDGDGILLFTSNYFSVLEKRENSESNLNTNKVFTSGTRTSRSMRSRRSWSSLARSSEETDIIS